MGDSRGRSEDAMYCPRCGGVAIPIGYGLPGAELEERARRGEVELGGCCIAEDDPVWRCTACGRAFGRRPRED